MHHWTERVACVRSVPIGRAPEGEIVKLVGVVRCAAPIASPLTAPACAAWEVALRSPAGAMTYLQTGEATAFHLVDEAGARAWVRPSECKVRLRLALPPASRLVGHVAWRERHVPPPHRRKEMLFHEGLLRDGDRVAVMGLCVREPDPEASAGYRVHALRTVVCAVQGGDPLYLCDDPDAML